MAVFYKSDSVPAAVADLLTLPRPVDTIVMVSGVMYRSTSASVATYSAVDSAGSLDVVNGETFQFDSGDVVFTPDGTDVRVTGTGAMEWDDDVLLIVDPVDATRRTRIDSGNVTTATTRVLTMADADIDLGNAVQRVLVTIPGGAGAGNVGALAATPVTVIAAPGADKFIEVVSAHFFLDYGTATYDGAATTTLRYTNGAGAAILGTAVPAANLITSASDAHVIAHPADNVIPVADAVVVVDCSVDPFAAAGDSPLLVEIFYRVRDLTPA